jgi:hypothetical protein
MMSLLVGFARAKDYWKGLLLVALGALIIMLSLLVPFSSFLPAWAYWDGSLIIGPDGSSEIRVDPSLGSVTRFMLVISGDGLVNLIVSDQSGNIVMDKRLESGRYTYDLPAGIMISYKIFLKDVSSSLHSIYWIVWAYDYSIILQLGSIIPLVLGAYLILSLYKHKRDEMLITPKKIRKKIKPSTHEDSTNCLQRAEILSQEETYSLLQEAAKLTD